MKLLTVILTVLISSQALAWSPQPKDYEIYQRNKWLDLAIGMGQREIDAIYPNVDHPRPNSGELASEMASWEVYFKVAGLSGTLNSLGIDYIVLAFDNSERLIGYEVTFLYGEDVRWLKDLDMFFDDFKSSNLPYKRHQLVSSEKLKLTHTPYQLSITLTAVH